MEISMIKNKRIQYEKHMNQMSIHKSNERDYRNYKSPSKKKIMYK